MQASERCGKGSACSSCCLNLVAPDMGDAPRLTPRTRGNVPAGERASTRIDEMRY